MGSAPKLPPPPPPPPAPVDEADAAPQAVLIAQRRGLAMNGYRNAYLSGARGPGGPAWQPKETPAPTPPQQTGTAPGQTGYEPSNYSRDIGGGGVGRAARRAAGR